MGRTHGVRRGTRYMFARSFRKNGSFGITKNMTIYKVGDIVDVKVRNSSAQVEVVLFFSRSINYTALVGTPMTSCDCPRAPNVYF